MHWGSALFFENADKVVGIGTDLVSVLGWWTAPPKSFSKKDLKSGHKTGVMK